MVDGVPVGELFQEATIPAIERASRGRTGCVIRAYGEMVDVPVEGGHTVAATKLEMLVVERTCGLAPVSACFAVLDGAVLQGRRSAGDLSAPHACVVGDGELLPTA